MLIRRTLFAGNSPGSLLAVCTYNTVHYGTATCTNSRRIHDGQAIPACYQANVISRAIEIVWK